MHRVNLNITNSPINTWGLIEYPSAIAQVCTQYGLDELEHQAITDLYDQQG